MRTKVKNGETILFIGDSITDCGRRGTEKPLGDGYVRLFSDLMAIREPARKVTIINKGIGGNRVDQLAERWTDDAMRFKPDWLSIKIGINDLHSTFRQDTPSIDPKVFREHYEDILSRTRKALPKCKLLLIDPFYLSVDGAEGTWRQQVLKLLPSYISTVHAMSRKYKTRLVKTHDMFQKLLKYYSADFFCQEPVHPQRNGHLAIAEEVYKALS